MQEQYLPSLAAFYVAVLILIPSCKSGTQVPAAEMQEACTNGQCHTTLLPLRRGAVPSRLGSRSVTLYIGKPTDVEGYRLSLTFEGLDPTGQAVVLHTHAIARVTSASVVLRRRESVTYDLGERRLESIQLLQMSPAFVVCEMSFYEFNLDQDENMRDGKRG